MPNTIADNLARLQTARTDIANAITTMGGTVSAGGGLEDFPAEILALPVPTFEVCELIKSSGIGGDVYGINTQDRTIVAGLLYKTGGYSTIALTFPQGFTPRYTKSTYQHGVYYDYGYGSPRTFDQITVTDSTITLTLDTLRGFNNSSQTSRIPICIQFGTNA